MFFVEIIYDYFVFFAEFFIFLCYPTTWRQQRKKSTIIIKLFVGEIMNKKKILKLALIFIVTLSVVLGLGYMYLNEKYQKMYEKRVKTQHDITITDKTKTDKEKKETEKLMEGSVNVLILGTDDGGYRTDVAMLIHYDTYSKSTSLFSVPRDYMITLSEKAQEQLNYYAPFIKFTEIMAYCKLGEMESPSSYVAQVVEELLDIKIDHFVLVNLDAFRTAVDSIGGVEVYVPQRMRWNDPIQNLNIDLEPGVQVLNGEQAEGLVRFRQGYDRNDYGDYGRMEMQQYFLTAYVKKLLKIENVTKIDELLHQLSEMLTTDASLADALVLLNTARDADFTRVNAHTLPGYDNMIDGKYFYSPPSDLELKRYFLETIISDTSVLDKSSKDIKLEVYSGQYDTTATEKIIEKLQQDGYNTEFMGVDPGPRTLKTKIIVPKLNLGNDLKKYFSISEIVVEPDESEEIKSIKIIVGEVQPTE